LKNREESADVLTTLDAIETARTGKEGRKLEGMGKEEGKEMPNLLVRKFKHLSALVMPGIEV